jgi:predicted dithiol-disulfide oxidoreductase (DUF899 family)
MQVMLDHGRKLQRILIHLNHRDVTFTAISRAPFAKIDARKRRMGWSFRWVPSYGSDFNYDYHTTFTPEEIAAGKGYYNYGVWRIGASDEVGIRVFARHQSGDVFYNFSCYGRGSEMLNGPYHYLDLVLKGRDEDSFDFSMTWVRRHDQC